jgi:hypothetical protein
VDRFSHPDYTPTEQDILRTRCRTTGIDEAIFVFEDLEFRYLPVPYLFLSLHSSRLPLSLIDVGGQRSERRKWIHNFDCVTAVLFCVALSDYDQVLREDATQNRMKEALLLFDEICNSPWFRSVDFIVFFNKTDLFREKFPRSPLTTCFPHYSGTCPPDPISFLLSTPPHWALFTEGPNPDTAKLFISKQFLELNHSPHRIYPHFTCAIDPGNMKIVFSAVRKTLLSLRLGEAGIGSVWKQQTRIVKTSLWITAMPSLTNFTVWSFFPLHTARHSISSFHTKAEPL